MVHNYSSALSASSSICSAYAKRVVGAEEYWWGVFLRPGWKVHCQQGNSAGLIPLHALLLGHVPGWEQPTLQSCPAMCVTLLVCFKDKLPVKQLFPIPWQINVLVSNEVERSGEVKYWSRLWFFRLIGLFKMGLSPSAWCCDVEQQSGGVKNLFSSVVKQFCL